MQEKEYKTRKAGDFYTVYFALCRARKTAQGYQDGKRIFELQDGKECLQETQAFFTAKRYDWRKPTKEMVEGALNQFKNLSELSRAMGISRVTVGEWKKKGGRYRIAFLHWRYLCEFIGIHEPLKHNLEYKDPVWIETKSSSELN
jgi:hypothetical protein